MTTIILSATCLVLILIIIVLLLRLNLSDNQSWRVENLRRSLDVSFDKVKTEKARADYHKDRARKLRVVLYFRPTPPPTLVRRSKQAKALVDGDTSAPEDDWEACWGIVQELARESCCINEQRNMDGGCDNCGLGTCSIASRRWQMRSR